MPKNHRSAPGCGPPMFAQVLSKMKATTKVAKKNAGTIAAEMEETGS